MLEEAGSVAIRTRLKYSNISSGTASLRMGTITACVVEYGLNVRLSDVLGKFIPPVLRERSQNLYRIAAYSDEIIKDLPIAVLFMVCKDTLTPLASIPLSKDTACTIWDPHLSMNILAIEGTQKFAMRVCLKNWRADYDLLLNLAHLPRLSSRREFLKLCLLFNIFTGKVAFHDSPLVR